MRRKKIVVSESELIRSIEKIVNEQTAMLGFGNMGGLSLGVSKPSDKYELDEDSQDTNTSDTINVNYMDQNAANQNMEDWEMGEDYSIERGSHGHPHDMDEGCGDDEMYEGCGDNEMYEGCGDDEMYEGCGDDEMYEGCGDEDELGEGAGAYNRMRKILQGLNPFNETEEEMNEDSGAFEDNYFNSIKGIRTADVYSESRLKNLVRNELLETQSKDAKKWIQGAVKRPRALGKKLGVKKGDKIPLSRINQEMRKIKAAGTSKNKKGVQGLSKSNARTYRQLNLAKTLKGLSKKKHAKEAGKWVRK